MEKPRCERCKDTAFMKPGQQLCSDCFKWMNSLGVDAKAHDAMNWGATGQTRRKPKAPPEEKPVLERYGFTKAGDIPLP
jgi:hypothetical protein